MKLKTPKELGITPTQFKNLCKLVTFVRTSVPPPEFNLLWWYTDKNGGEETRPADAVYECGTTACFCGYGPLAGIKPQPKDDWYSYQRRVFGTEGSTIGETVSHKLFNLLFEGTHENSKKAAVLRGAYFLTHGLPEEKFLSPLSRWEAPASFRPPWKLIAQHSQS